MYYLLRGVYNYEAGTTRVEHFSETTRYDFFLYCIINRRARDRDIWTVLLSTGFKLET